MTGAPDKGRYMRTLTVSSLHREWGEPHRKRECIVPSIRLNGKWLTSLGIKRGQKIRVITNGGTITLVPVLDSEPTALPSESFPQGSRAETQPE